MQRYHRGGRASYGSSGNRWIARGSRGGYRLPPAAPPALGKEIRRITLDYLDTNAEMSLGAARITECEYIASYNLMSDMTKKILVPGRPPLWTPMQHAQQLQEDNGLHYRDENSARFPDHPFEPLAVSIARMNADFDLSLVDVAACAHTLSELVRFVRGRGGSFAESTFVVQVIGETAFFIRREKSPQAIIEDIHGYGFAFHEANTSWSEDVNGSLSHQRIISYQLGGMKLLVKFEADVTNEAVESKYEQGHAEPCWSLGQDNRAKSSLEGSPNSATEATTVIEKGLRIAQSSLVDVKTRTIKRPRELVMSDVLPQLWIRQVSNLVLSFHTSGHFEAPQIEDVTSAIQEWESDNPVFIRRLVILIRELKKAAVNARGGKIEVRCIDGEAVQLRELSTTDAERWNALPSDLHNAWAGEDETWTL